MDVFFVQCEFFVIFREKINFKFKLREKNAGHPHFFSLLLVFKKQILIMHTQIKLVDPILYLVFLIHDLLRRKKVAVY